MDKNERRDLKRLGINIKVKVFILKNRSSYVLDGYLLETKDITSRGLFLKSETTFPLKTKLRIEVDLEKGSAPASAEGEVAWITKPSDYYSGMGVNITKIKRADANRIKKFFNGKLQNYKDALELKGMYMQLKAMAARLLELEESHAQAENFRKAINQAVKDIDHIAHIIDREVWEIKSL